MPKFKNDQDGDRMNKSKIIILLTLQFLLFSAALGDESTHRQAAEKLLNFSGVKQALDKSVEQMLIIQIQQRPTLAPYKKIMLQFLQKYMSFESLREELVSIYVEEFTERELNEIVAFYSTPTGRKTIEKLPVLASKGAQLGVSRIRQNISELEEMINAETQRIQKLQEADKKE
jgi:hypothetical protein